MYTIHTTITFFSMRFVYSLEQIAILILQMEKWCDTQSLSCFYTLHPKLPACFVLKLAILLFYSNQFSPLLLLLSYIFLLFRNTRLYFLILFLRLYVTWIYNIFFWFLIFSGDQTTWMKVDCGEERQKRKTSRCRSFLAIFMRDKVLLTRRIKM